MICCDDCECMYHCECIGIGNNSKMEQDWVCANCFKTRIGYEIATNRSEDGLVNHSNYDLKLKSKGSLIHDITIKRHKCRFCDNTYLLTEDLQNHLIDYHQIQKNNLDAFGSYEFSKAYVREKKLPLRKNGGGISLLKKSYL